MFSFFSSKNQKLVKQWKKEHKEIVELATKIINNYTKSNHREAKKALKKLMILAGDHLMEEDLEINNLTKDRDRSDTQIELEISKFKDSFVGVKKTVLDFLWHYSQEETILDKAFFEQFNSIVAVLAQRIEFEEKNLYSKLESK